MTQSPPNFGLQSYQYSGPSSSQQYSSPRWEIPSAANGYGQSRSSFSSPMYQYQPSSLGTRSVQPVDSFSSSGLSGDFFRSSAPFQGTSGGALSFSGSFRPSFECKRDFSVSPKGGPAAEYSRFLKSEPPFKAPDLSLKDRSADVSAFPLQRPESGSFPAFADRKFSVESKMLDHSLRNRSGAFSLGAPSQRSSSTDFSALAERSFSAESRIQDLSLRGRAGDFPSGFPLQRSALDSFSGFVARNFSVEFRDHSALSSQRPGLGSFQGSSALSRMPLASSGKGFGGISFDLSQSQFRERINRTMQRTFRGDFSPSRPLFTPFERFLFSKSVAITLEKGMNRTVFVFSPNPTTTFIIDPKNLGESLRQMAAKTSVVSERGFSQEGTPSAAFSSRDLFDSKRSLSEKVAFIVDVAVFRGALQDAGRVIGYLTDEPLGSSAQAAEEVGARILNSPQFRGALQFLGGLSEASVGAGMILFSEGIVTPLGWPVMVHGLDHAITGARAAITGRPDHTATSQLLQQTGLSPHQAAVLDGVLGMAGGMGGVAAIRYGRTAAFPEYLLPAHSLMAENGVWMLPENGGGAFINNRWYTEHALERMAPRTPQVMAILERRFNERSQIVRQELNAKEFLKWQRLNTPAPRGIPPMVVEAEILNPGSTNIRIELNPNGNVITVIPRGK